MMMKKGSMMIQYQPLGDLPNFFRIAFSNPAITTADADYVIEEIASLGKQLVITEGDSSNEKTECHLK